MSNNQTSSHEYKGTIVSYQPGEISYANTVSFPDGKSFFITLENTSYKNNYADPNEQPKAEITVDGVTRIIPDAHFCKFEIVDSVTENIYNVQFIDFLPYPVITGGTKINEKDCTLIKEDSVPITISLEKQDSDSDAEKKVDTYFVPVKSLKQIYAPKTVKKTEPTDCQSALKKLAQILQK